MDHMVMFVERSCVLGRFQRRRWKVRQLELTESHRDYELLEFNAYLREKRYADADMRPCAINKCRTALCLGAKFH
jgi:hypothetical protein